MIDDNAGIGTPIYSDDNDENGGKVRRDNKVINDITVDEQTVMERLDFENDKTTRNKILNETRIDQVGVYNDVAELLQDNNVQDN